jgi:hypothetical protein
MECTKVWLEIITQEAWLNKLLHFKVINILSKNSKLRERDSVLQLLAVKFITYPIIGFSTLFACKIVRERFSIEEFNCFVLIWGSIGLIGIIEYGLGINLTNHLIIRGFDASFRKKLKITTIVLILPLLISLSIGITISSTGIIKSYSLLISNVDIQIHELAIYVSLSVICITFYNLVTRISNGLSRFNQPNTTLALGNILVIVALLMVESYSFSLLMYIAILASAYFFSAIFQIASRNFRVFLNNHSIPDRNIKFETGLMGKRYSMVVIAISIFASFINFYPRWKFASSGTSVEVSGYLTAILVLGIFNSISSALGPFLWNIGIQRNASRDTGFPMKAYKLAIYMNVFLAIPFLITIVVLMNYYNIQFLDSKVILLGILAYCSYFLQNLHMIPSNYLNGIGDLTLQLGLLVLQAIALILCLEYLAVKTANSIYLIQLVVIFFLSFGPSIFILSRKSNA